MQSDRSPSFYFTSYFFLLVISLLFFFYVFYYIIYILSTISCLWVEFILFSFWCFIFRQFLKLFAFLLQLNLFFFHFYSSISKVFIFFFITVAIYIIQHRAHTYVLYYTYILIDRYICISLIYQTWIVNSNIPFHNYDFRFSISIFFGTYNILLNFHTVCCCCWLYV